MVRYIKREDIFIEKYNACIANALNTRIYAYAWYLDIVADNWGVLVYKDYEAVMPLPWRSKYFIKYVYQPNFTQQLGLFYQSEKPKYLESLFFEKLKIRFVRSYNFNSSTSFKSSRLQEKVNFEIQLNQSIDTVRKSYRKDRRKSLRKALKANLTIANSKDVNLLIALYKETFSFVNHQESLYEDIQNVVNYCLANKQGFIKKICEDDKVVAMAFLLKDAHRIYYLFGASNVQGRKNGATTFMIDKIIEEHSNSEMIFDFEGSIIPNVADFYKSFGAEVKKYYSFSTKNFL